MEATGRRLLFGRVARELLPRRELRRIRAILVTRPQKVLVERRVAELMSSAGLLPVDAARELRASQRYLLVLVHNRLRAALLSTRHELTTRGMLRTRPVREGLSTLGLLCCHGVPWLLPRLKLALRSARGDLFTLRLLRAFQCLLVARVRLSSILRIEIVHLSAVFEVSLARGLKVTGFV